MRFLDGRLSRRSLLISVVAATAILAGTAAFLFVGSAEPDDWSDDIDLETYQIRANVFVVEGTGLRVGGGNVIVQIGDDGVLLVDSQFEALSMRVLEAIRTITDKPIRVLINTHGHPDHVGGNAFLSANATVGAGAPLRIIAHRDVASQMRAGGFPPAGYPTEPFGEAGVQVAFNGELVSVAHQANAHTSSDSIVVFESSAVVATGDIYNGLRYPLIDRWKGGNTFGLLEGLDRLAGCIDASRDSEHGVLVVPGHGRPVSGDEIVRYRDKVATIIERVAEAAASGMSIRQVQALQLTRDFDEQFDGDVTGLEANDFVGAVYRDLVESGSPGALADPAAHVPVSGAGDRLVAACSRI